VQDKLAKLVCLTIEGLDVDGIRVDKVTQMTINFMKVLGPKVRECAAAVNKTNFLLTGEITSGSVYGSLFLGRGKTPDQYSLDNLNHPENTFGPGGQVGPTMRKEFGIDSQAFSYSLYRGLLDFLGLRGTILTSYDVGSDPIEAYNTFLQQIDYVNAFTGKTDPRDLWGVGNQDTFRWPSIMNGKLRFQLGQIITTFVLPGSPLVIPLNFNF
jgi:alpha-1,3-glucan synthase